MQAITLEVIMRAVFGVSDAAARDALRESLVAILAESASPAAIGLAVGASGGCRTTARFAGQVARADELLAAEISERRGDPGLSERQDILSMLVAAEFEDGTKMSDRELRDQLMTLLLAGHETTATALAWTFDLLLHTPAALERLTAELADGEGEYLDAVVSESLRLRPVVPITGRLLHEPRELGGYELPAGTIVLAAIYMAHTNADIYPEPVRVPPRALPRRRPRDLFVDSVRRRHAALHRRRLRPARDARSRCARSSPPFGSRRPSRGRRRWCAATSPSRRRTARG